MAYNGAGVFNLYTPGNPVVTGTTIQSTWANNTLSDIATGLSTALTKDGQTTATAAIPFALGLSSAALVDISAAGAGQIKFPATQNASANANTLDDYEEGTWTPAPASSGGTITTVGAVAGTYTKIGRQVTVNYSIAITDNGTGSGFITVSGLPFTSFATQRCMGAGYNNSTALIHTLHVPAGTTTILTYRYDGAYPVATGQTMSGTITYFV